jgi:hypothetical protein
MKKEAAKLDKNLDHPCSLWRSDSVEYSVEPASSTVSDSSSLAGVADAVLYL